jgi:hypothetical protein
MAGSLPADLFNEVGDAGGLLDNAAVTSGAGALTQIMGTLGLGDADLYAIYVDGGGTFSATTVGGVAPGFDTQLFLLDSTVTVFISMTTLAGSRPRPRSLPVTR